jgi:hypothetical protein
MKYGIAKLFYAIEEPFPMNFVLMKHGYKYCLEDEKQDARF